MIYREIPNTELKPSAICMGGVSLCLEDDIAGVFALLDSFYELGGTFIDSANIYGKWLPSGENVCDINIGKWLKSRGLRNKIIVASKGGHPPLDTLSEVRLSKAEVAADLDESLKALGTDYIDLYYLHRDDESIPVEIIIDYLNDFVKAGKIRYFGASNWQAARIKAAQMYAKKSVQMGFSANQLMWSYPVADLSYFPYPGAVNMDKDSMTYHLESGLTAIAYQSQARGFFQKYANRDSTPLADNLNDMYNSSENTLRFERAVKLSKNIGVSLTAICLAYILNHPFPSYAIIGSHSKEQLEDSTVSAELLLTPEQIKYLAIGIKTES